MTESIESLPLPEHPLLASWALALNDLGDWAEVLDSKWRFVFVTDELRLSYRDMGPATDPPVGSHFFSSEARELLDRALIWNHRQLERLLGAYVAHYNTHRPHRALAQRAPSGAEVVEFRPGQPIRRHSSCGGLINEYRQAA